VAKLDDIQQTYRPSTDSYGSEIHADLSIHKSHAQREAQ